MKFRVDTYVQAIQPVEVEVDGAYYIDEAISEGDYTIVGEFEDVQVIGVKQAATQRIYEEDKEAGMPKIVDNVNKSNEWLQGYRIGVVHSLRREVQKVRLDGTINTDFNRGYMEGVQDARGIQEGFYAIGNRDGVQEERDRVERILAETRSQLHEGRV